MVRVKHRYLLVHILQPDSAGAASLPAAVLFSPPTPDSVEARTLLRAIRDNLSLLFGDYGAAAAGSTAKINYFSNATSTFVVRAPRDHYRLVWAALSHVTSLPGPKGGMPCVMRVVRVSGTIRKAEQEAVRRARRAIGRARGQESSAEDALLAGLLGPEPEPEGVETDTGSESGGA